MLICAQFALFATDSDQEEMNRLFHDYTTRLTYWSKTNNLHSSHKRPSILSFGHRILIQSKWSKQCIRMFYFRLPNVFCSVSSVQMRHFQAFIIAIIIHSAFSLQSRWITSSSICIILHILLSLIQQLLIIITTDILACATYLVFIIKF